MRWVVWGAMITGGSGLILYILPGALGIYAVNPNLIGVIVLPFPIALAVAILRHNLFDIDQLINRTLVYTLLFVITTGIYIFLVGFIGSQFQERGRSAVAFLATGLVAVGFQPILGWLQRLVNRWMYGERDNPYAVLAGLGRRLESAMTSDAVLTVIVETIATALKLPYVAISWHENNELTEAASFGLPTDAGIFRQQLTYQKIHIGELVVAQRSPEEPFSPGELHLLRDLARQVEIAVHNVRLTADLRRSRQRLVTAREEERRRIRRDLHDGLGPQLASQALTLNAVEKLVYQDPTQAVALIKNLQEQTQEAVGDIRALIYGLRPPVLDDLGLVAALRREIQRFEVGNLEIRLVAPASLPPLPAAVDAAAYRIILEAVNNIHRHARAALCTIHIQNQPDRLRIRITDDGRGLPDNIRAGIGLTAMRERAEEIGGWFETTSQPDEGTTITAWLPIEEREE
jgi:signal transduction histidine kinase